MFARRCCLALLVTSGAMLSQDAAENAFRAAVARQQAGQLQEAGEAYRSYIKRFGATPEALANLGAVLVRLGQYPEAVAAYTRALKLAPTLLPVRLNLGLAYLKSGKPADAASQFAILLKAEPGNRQALQLHAMSLLEAERFTEAVAAYRALMPTADLGIRLGLATAHMRLGETEEARALAEPLLQSDTAEAKLLAGQILAADGQLEEARYAFGRARELNPNLPALRLHLGSVYWRLGEADAALREWRAELAERPHSHEANYTVGAALAFTKSGSAEAEQLLRTAVALKPRGAPALYQLAKLIWQRSKSQEALSLLERSVAADPAYREARYLLAVVYQAAGRKQEAAREFAAVKRLSERDLQRTQDIFESSR